MLDLGDYGSSEEEEEVPVTKENKEQQKRPREQDDPTISKEKSQPLSRGDDGPPKSPGLETKIDSQPSQTRNFGPALGPSALPQPELDPGSAESRSRSQSPYSSTREMIRNLTMPPVPNFEIPPSPPSSPPEASTTKFARFLELKKKGVHFNEKLEGSSALRNPALLTKLREFAGISDEEQYQSSLPPDLALRTTFPDWAYFDELAKTQQKVAKKREEEQSKKQRDGIDFVSAGGSNASSRVSTPGGGKGLRTSAAERVIGGLSKGSSERRDGSRHRELERRGGRQELGTKRQRSRSRSPRQ